MKAVLIVCLVLAAFSTVDALAAHYSRYEQGNAYDYVPAQQQASVNYAQSFDPKYIPQFREDGDGATDSIEQSQPAGEASQTEVPPTSEAASPEEQADPSGEEQAEPQAEQPQLTPALVQNPNPEAEQQGVALPPEPTLAPVGHSEETEEADPAAEETDPEILKLNAALEAVKEDIISNSKQIGEERMWVAAVVKITASYEEKVQRVRDHIIELRKEMKKLYEKKKQIENLKLQRALEKKLKEAQDELTSLQDSLNSVQEKNAELHKSHEDLQTTIASIEAQLAKLKGEDPAVAEEEEKEQVDEDAQEDKLEDASDASAATLETPDDE
jgi:predicted  nucleic acid-binding Zn-ribbon protein